MINIDLFDVLRFLDTNINEVNDILDNLDDEKRCIYNDGYLTACLAIKDFILYGDRDEK